MITRASNNYGPYAYPEKVIPLFITNLVDGVQVPIFGEGRQVRDWLYVEDHCRAIKLLVDHGINGEVYNVGGNQEFENIELTRKLLAIMGKDERSITFVQDRPGNAIRLFFVVSFLVEPTFVEANRLQRRFPCRNRFYGLHQVDRFSPIDKSLVHASSRTAGRLR